MMNIKEEDVNLELGMDSSKFCIRKKLLSTSSGAGVNADSRANLAFATTDPLSELVWSPHNGLSLKCASSTAADKKPFRLWNVGPGSTVGLSPLQSIRLNGSGDGAAVDEGNLTISPGVLDADDMIIDKATSFKPSENCHSHKLGPSHCDCDGMESDRILEEGDGIREDNCMMNWQVNPQNVQTGGINNDIAGVTPQTPLKELESSAENELCRLTENGSLSLGGEDHPRENALPAEGPPTGSRICLYQEDGKVKALSDGDVYGRSSNDEDDDSHESAESCNSAGLSSKGMKGVKRQIYHKGTILGSKRMKMQTHGSHGSTPVTKPDSSFMNWISNMTKGLSDCNKEGSPSPLTIACFNDVYDKNYHEMYLRQQGSASISMGFQTIFQGLYCKEADAMDNGGKKIIEPMKESREHAVDEKKSPKTLPRSYDKSSGCSSAQTLLCNKEVDPTHTEKFESSLAVKASEDLVSDIKKEGVIPPHALDEEMKTIAKEAHLDTPKATCDVLVKGDPRTSLWITRFSAKTLRSDKGKEIDEESIGCSTFFPESDLQNQMNAVFPIEHNSSEARGESADFKLNASTKESRNFIIKSKASFQVKAIRKLSPVLPSQRFSSEAMASAFAQRLDALRHITSSKTGKSLACSHICFYCGGFHDVHECPNVTKSELEDLLLKLNTFEGSEGSSCLCIRCCKSDHWAVSCPLAPSSRKQITEQKAIACSSRRPPLGYTPTYQAWKLDISTSSETQRQPALKSTKDVEDNRTYPVRDIATQQNTVAKSQIFDAIKNLRLSRGDILRWMNSNVPWSCLNGFFLRLRLGKLEAGLGGSMYYLACIAGDERENGGYNKSILVDVGGSKSYVAIQHVSNHDFLEDEIEAWWRRTMNSGCKLPSLADLNSKLNHKRTLVL